MAPLIDANRDVLHVFLTVPKQLDSERRTFEHLRSLVT